MCVFLIIIFPAQFATKVYIYVTPTLLKLVTIYNVLEYLCVYQGVLDVVVKETASVKLCDTHTRVHAVENGYLSKK